MEAVIKNNAWRNILKSGFRNLNDLINNLVLIIQTLRCKKQTMASRKNKHIFNKSDLNETYSTWVI